MFAFFRHAFEVETSRKDLTLHGETLAHQLKEAEEAITFLKKAIQAGPRRAREASEVSLFLRADMNF